MYIKVSSIWCLCKVNKQLEILIDTLENRTDEKIHSIPKLRIRSK